MNFLLNRPALQTAGQILDQQCGAAAAAQRGALPEPVTGALALSAITELARAAAAHAAPKQWPEFESGLARAVIHIFDLAALQGVELGSVIAEQLEQSALQRASLAA